MVGSFHAGQCVSWFSGGCCAAGGRGWRVNRCVISMCPFPSSGVCVYACVRVCVGGGGCVSVCVRACVCVRARVSSFSSFLLLRSVRQVLVLK